MVIIGLILIALSCLVVGLVLQSTIWLVASLIATTGAGFLLYKLRGVITASEPSTEPDASTKPGASTEPEPGAEPGAAIPAGRAEAIPANNDAKAPVARHADNSGSSPQTGVDTTTSVGRHGRGGAVDEATDPDADQVWVIDGRPRYHSGDCAIIKGQQAESIPFGQATEDGFTACSLCEPHAVRTR